MSQPSVDIRAFGENGWLVRFAPSDDSVALALYADAIATRLRKQEGVIDAIAGIDSMAMRYDPFALTAEDSRAQLEKAISATKYETAPAPTKTIEIPVCYGGAFGPDFDKLCESNNLSPDALIEIHSAQAYRVLMIGFAPGFAYMGPLDHRLNAPRLATPRARVEAGSIGIAGAFTGAYSLASPGGWNIIGRTPMLLFNPKAEDPFVFAAGAEVRFSPIGEDEFRARAA